MSLREILAAEGFPPPKKASGVSRVVGGITIKVDGRIDSRLDKLPRSCEDADEWGVEGSRSWGYFSKKYPQIKKIGWDMAGNLTTIAADFAEAVIKGGGLADLDGVTLYFGVGCPQSIAYFWLKANVSGDSVSFTLSKFENRRVGHKAR